MGGCTRWGPALPTAAGGLQLVWCFIGCQLYGKGGWTVRGWQGGQQAWGAGFSISRLSASPPVSLQGVPVIVQIPFALSLSSSAFQMGPQFLCTALPLLSASLAWPRQGESGVRPSFLPSQPQSCCHWSPHLGPGGREAEKAAPSQQGNGTWALICVASCLASENTATFWACFSRLLRKHRMSKAYQYICTFSTWAPERLWARRGGRRVWGVFPAWEVSIRPNKVTLTPHLSLSFVPDNSCITANWPYNPVHLRKDLWFWIAA